MVCARFSVSDVDATLSYACHIHPVLDRLGVTLIYGGLA